MAETEDEVAAAQAYEELHVPAIFEQWAPKMAEGARIRSGQRVLDLACGTGALARQLLPIVGDSGSIVGLDVASGMLTVARRLAPKITWQHGVAESLPFDEFSFDAVVCQFGLMFFQDRRTALNEMLRVLKPGSWFSMAVWASLEDSDVYREEVALLESLAGQNAANALRAPFVLGNTDELSEMFALAGLESVAIETHKGTGRFPSIQAIVEADLKGWLPLMGVDLSEGLIAKILKESEQALAQYVVNDGSVQFDAPAHIISGRRTD